MDYAQYKGKPFQIISKMQVRYSGVLEDLDQESQTLCLSEVYNHGTEDRPSPRVLPGSNVSLGWVRFHTNSIESLALVENYQPPGHDDALVDPILASVSKTGPSSQNQPRPAGLASLPPKPLASAPSHAAVDRGQRPEQSDNHHRRQPKPQPPAVPDAEFDFSKGNDAFRKEREAHKHAVVTPPPAEPTEVADVGEPEHQPHPAAIARAAPPPADKPDRKAAAYSKSSFFDNISSDTSRVSRADERHRNFDTFGEAGGQDNGGGMRPYGYNSSGGGGGGYGGQQRGGGGRGRGRRGGYGGQQQQAQHQQQS